MEKQIRSDFMVQNQDEFEDEDFDDSESFDNMTLGSLEDDTDK